MDTFDDAVGANHPSPFEARLRDHRIVGESAALRPYSREELETMPFGVEG